MQRNVALGIQNFSKLRENNYFYIDKTRFIKEWWERGDDITLITRPRRFGKTLMLDMVKTFFSPEYSGRCDLFEGLSIWNEKKYRELQGTTPVIFLSFANIKELSFSAVKYNICSILTRLYSQYGFIISSQVLSKNEIRRRKYIENPGIESLNQLLSVGISQLWLIPFLLFFCFLVTKRYSIPH